MTPIDHADMMKRTMTTNRASQLIWPHMARGSKLIAGAASWRSKNAQTCNCKTIFLSCELI
jgi:hypothetical protein